MVGTRSQVWLEHDPRYGWNTIPGIGGGTLRCGVEGRRDRFFDKSIGVGTPDLLCFLQFWVVLEPYFLSEFLEAFLAFFCLFKKSLLGLSDPLYDALQSRGRSSTHRGYNS